MYAFISEQRYRLNIIDNNNNYSNNIFDRNKDDNAYYVLSLIIHRSLLLC